MSSYYPRNPKQLEVLVIRLRPKIVAKAWSDAFIFFNKAFKEVDFAIYGSERNYSAFNSKFQPNL